MVTDNNGCFQIYEGFLSEEEGLHYVSPGLVLGAKGRMKGKIYEGEEELSIRTI